MKFPSRETVVIRTVYEDTYDTLLDYVLDTSIYEGVGKVHTIWMKGKDPRKCPTCGTRITGLLSDEYNSTGSQF